MVKIINLGEKQKCLRCNHKWLPRTTEIFTCPKCRSPYWDKEKKKSKRKIKGIDEE